MRPHVLLLLALSGVFACPTRTTEPLEPDESTRAREAESARRAAAEAEAVRQREVEAAEGEDPRLDPVRCTGDSLDIEALTKAGVCTIPIGRARPLAGDDQLAIEVPRHLGVAPGQPLEFDLVLRNIGREPLDIDVVFPSLPLAPESTAWIGKGQPAGASPDPSCNLRAISTEPPPERITLPPGGELPVPCEWHANIRLIDPQSYVGSECPDFPALSKGNWRSVFRMGGRSVEVDIKVK